MYGLSIIPFDKQQLEFVLNIILYIIGIWHTVRYVGI